MGICFAGPRAISQAFFSFNVSVSSGVGGFLVATCDFYCQSAARHMHSHWYNKPACLRQPSNSRSREDLECSQHSLAWRGRHYSGPRPIWEVEEPYCSTSRKSSCVGFGEWAALETQMSVLVGSRYIVEVVKSRHRRTGRS